MYSIFWCFLDKQLQHAPTKRKQKEFICDFEGI